MPENGCGTNAIMQMVSSPVHWKTCFGGKVTKNQPVRFVHILAEMICASLCVRFIALTLFKTDKFFRINILYICYALRAAGL